jgi:hypothetical protein
MNRRRHQVRVLRPYVHGALGAFAMHHGMAAAASPEAPVTDEFSINALAAESYDSNLFRLPADAGDLGQLIGPGSRREDYITRVSVGATAQRALGNQALVLDLDVDDNRYRYNGFLDNVSGHGKLRWNWSIASVLTGQVGADYARALTSFANNKVFAKDLLDTQGYFVNANYHLRSGWALTFGARHARSSHSVELQQINDSNSTSGSAGVMYESGSGNVVGAEYRYSAASYPHDVVSAGGNFDRRYRENTWDGYVEDALTAKLQLQASGGYLKHRYPDDRGTAFSPDFSGAVWNLALQYQPTGNTSIAVAEQRQLRAYLDSESDYFVSDGVTFSPSWTATDRLKFALKYSYERQQFLGSNPNSIIQLDVPRRVDKVNSAQGDVTYTLFRHVELNLLYRYEKRDTNRSSFAYDDNIVALSVRVTTGASK